MNINLINHLADTIRLVDGHHTMGAAALAEAIVGELRTLAMYGDERVTDPVVEALAARGWEKTRDGGTLSHDDLASIARIVLRSLAEG
jgi:hypothetical protein